MATTEGSWTRVLDFDGVHNFRDYGGYAVAGGGRVRRGMLFRSGQHFEASDTDLSRLDALGLTSVFDLRTDRERRDFPCRRPPAFGGTVHFISDARPTGAAPHAEAAVNAPHVTAARRHRDAQSTREGMRRSYGSLPYRQPLGQAIGQMLRTLALGDEGPSLVNCMAGKDRTGIAVLAVQHALGVHGDDIIADYLLTNTAGNVAARIDAGYRTVQRMVGELDAESRAVMMGVEREYLDIAFATIEARSGSLDAWLAQELGVDAAMRDRLRERLVEA